jgi:hypothetical protein
MTLYQFRRRVALTPFDVGPLAQAHRNLSLASPASAKSVVRTAPRRATGRHSTVQVLSADRLLCRTRYLLRCRADHTRFAWRCNSPPFLPMAEATGFLAGIW